MAHLRANFVLLLATVSLCTTGCTGEVEGDGARTGEPRPTGGPAGETFPESKAVEPIVRRLTADEYARTVRDVVGVELGEADLERFPEARPIEGCIHVASGQTASTDHVRAYAELARVVTADASFDNFRTTHSQCSDPTYECAEAFIMSAGAALFRRPLRDDEMNSLGAFVDAILPEQVTYDEVTALVAEAMLQSPGFLYLLQGETEGSARRTLDGYEMAARLSYFLWGSAPDEALYQAAASGELEQVDAIEAQARRMLEDRARIAEGIGRFVVDWARLESLPDDDGLKGKRIEGAVAYYRDRVESANDMFALYGDGSLFADDALAEAYGLEPEGGNGMAEYAVPGGMGPGGLLGQPGVVAGMTNADGGEIVARGLFLMSQLFCEVPPQFNAALQDAIDEFIEEQPADASDRQIADTRLERPACAGCHGSFDPLAYGFEQFDYLGAFRTEDEFGNTLTTDGWIPGLLSDDGVDVAYEDTDALMSLLRESLKVRRCLTRHQTEYALGLKLGDGQARAVAEISAAAEAAGGSHEGLVMAIVTHELFRTTAVVP